LHFRLTIIEAARGGLEYNWLASAHMPDGQPAAETLTAKSEAGVIARRIPAIDAARIATLWRAFDMRLLQASACVNPFFLEGTLAPALEVFASEKVFLFCVFDGEALIGLTPLEKVRGYARLPVSYLRTWRHPHCFFGEPNIEPGREADFYRALFCFLDQNPSCGQFLRLEDVDGDGFAAHLAGSDLHDRLVYIEGEKRRAGFKGGLNFDEYYRENISAKQRKESRRLSNRLAEHGAAHSSLWRFGDDLDSWIEEFLRLESNSWKGEAGTSLSASERDTEFFRRSLRAMARAGALLFMRLKVGENTIAMLVNFAVGGAGYSFKICHDQAYERYSPGVLIELELMKYLEGRPDIGMFDSCASEYHPMINGLWIERRRIVGVNCSATGFFRKTVLQACAALEKIARRLRDRKAGTDAT
jgi:hypothetical protein